MVDLAQLLGPDAPAPLAVRLWLWYQDPDLLWRGATASGALLLLAITALLIALFRLLEWLHQEVGKGCWLDGKRSAPHSFANRLAAGFAFTLITLNLAVLAALLLWSLARRWPFPALWPSQWSGRYWLELLPTLSPLLTTSALLALASGILALVMTVLSLEAQAGRRPWPLWLICLPLLLPQASLLFGIRLGLDWLAHDSISSGIGWGWVLWSQLLFVFPYAYLCLHGPYRQFDPRITQSALLLGATPWRAWWQVKAPLLARPLLFAFGVGAAVSLAQYLPTLLFGAGRVVTITTEAVAIGSGLNRRLAGLYGLLQLLLPLIIYLLALWLPARINPALKGGRLTMNSDDGNSHMLSTTPLRLYLDENLLLSLPALQVAPGEVLTLMGPSGCGKSSLLAGLAGVLPGAQTENGPIRLEGGDKARRAATQHLACASEAHRHAVSG